MIGCIILGHNFDVVTCQLQINEPATDLAMGGNIETGQIETVMSHG